MRHAASHSDMIINHLQRMLEEQSNYWENGRLVDQWAELAICVVIQAVRDACSHAPTPFSRPDPGKQFPRLHKLWREARSHYINVRNRHILEAGAAEAFLQDAEQLRFWLDWQGISHEWAQQKIWRCIQHIRGGNVVAA